MPLALHFIFGFDNFNEYIGRDFMAGKVWLQL
jgi:hypothetical protein